MHLKPLIGCYIPMYALATFAADKWLQLGLQPNDDLNVYSYNVVGVAEMSAVEESGTAFRPV